MAKHAQIGVVRAAARALAPRRIRVNALNPGPIDNTFQYDIEERMSAIRGFNITQELNETIPSSGTRALTRSPMSHFTLPHP